jgi:TPR repeat protein
MTRPILVLLLFVVTALPAPADFKAGMQAYEAGDFETARREWEPLADDGVVEAQFNLGLIYHNGKGVPEDLGVAHGWYLKAAEGGYARAQVRVAEMYETGQGTRKDLIQAHYWFRRAADQKYEGAKKRKKRVAKQMTPEQIAYAELLMRQYNRGDADDD